MIFVVLTPGTPMDIDQHLDGYDEVLDFFGFGDWHLVSRSGGRAPTGRSPTTATSTSTTCRSCTGHSAPTSATSRSTTSGVPISG